MRLAVLLLLLGGLAAAQFEATEENLALCQKGCCERQNGTWDDNAAECAIEGGNYVDYSRCDNECLIIASRDYNAAASGAGCCAPALVLATLAMISSGSGRSAGQ